jgi:hypothetical protein
LPDGLRNHFRISRTLKAITTSWCPLQDFAHAEGDHHLMVPHALAAFDEAEIPHQAIAPAAHAGQATTSEETEHRAMMHRGAIPSILDGARILFVRQIRRANKRSTNE